MILKVECPHCTQPIEFPDELLGQLHQCPGCARQITLRPAPAAKAPVVPKIAAPAPPPPKIETALEDVGDQIYGAAIFCSVIVGMAALVVLVAALNDDGNGRGILAAVGIAITAIAFFSQGYILRLVFRGGGEGIRLLRKISEAKK